jgi:hypothetical protein
VPPGVNVAEGGFGLYITLGAGEVVGLMVKVKGEVVLLSESGDIDLEKLAVTFALMGTLPARFVGEVEVTTGGVAGRMVKVQTLSAASGRLSSRSLAAVVIFAVYAALYARLAVGVNVAVVPLYVTFPTTAGVTGIVGVGVIVKFGMTEVSTIGFEKIAVTVGSLATLVSPSFGLVLLTVGATALAVLKVQT